MNTRKEHDSMGELELPGNALYGAQTQRALQNFRFSDRRLPAAFIQRLALIKLAAAEANNRLGALDDKKAGAIKAAAGEVLAGAYLDQFPVDLFQTGSGTSTNMNMNEVLANLAGPGIHPNDDVNMSQSSNDVIPSCIQVAVTLEIEQALLPALVRFAVAVRTRADREARVIKTGRTHLMDAMPLSLGQEMGAWASQIEECITRLQQLLPRLRALPLGGTAVGTGVNSPPGFAALALAELSRRAGARFTQAPDRFSRMAGQDVAAECAMVLKGVALVLTKVSNDLRWMASGPLAGLGEIELKPLQPGSSIMPGKVNPVVPEAVLMLCAEVIGNEAAVTIAAQSGNFQLNVMLPLIADKLLGSISLLAAALPALSQTISDFKVNEQHLAQQLGRNPVLVTGLNRLIGYEAAAAIAKKAYATGRPVLDVAVEETGLARSDLVRLLDPERLARPAADD